MSAFLQSAGKSSNFSWMGVKCAVSPSMYAVRRSCSVHRRPLVTMSFLKLRHLVKKESKSSSLDILRDFHCISFSRFSIVDQLRLYVSFILWTMPTPSFRRCSLDRMNCSTVGPALLRSSLNKSEFCVGCAVPSGTMSPAIASYRTEKRGLARTASSF